MKDNTILLIGAGIFLGFFAFMSYLAFLSSNNNQIAVSSQLRMTPEQYFGGKYGQ